MFAQSRSNTPVQASAPNDLLLPVFPQGQSPPHGRSAARTTTFRAPRAAADDDDEQKKEVARKFTC